MRQKLWTVFLDNNGNRQFWHFLGEAQPSVAELKSKLDTIGLDLSEAETFRLINYGQTGNDDDIWMDYTERDPMDLPFTLAEDRVRLWWKAESMTEVQAWVRRVISAGGDIDKIEKQTEPTGTISYAFIFNLSRTVALEQFGYDETSLQENDLVASEELKEA